MKKFFKLIPDWIQNEFPSFLRSQFFQTTFGKIHYLSAGIGKNAVLLLHGNPSWSFIWRKIIGELGEKDFFIVAPDLLNLGFSDALSEEDFNIENHSKALSELIEGLNLNNITLVVQDWGGPIGLYTAAKMPSRFSKLVILNTGLSNPTPPYRVSKFHEFVNKKFLPEIAFKVLGFPLFTLHKVQHDKSSIKGNIARAYRYPVRVKHRWSSALQFARMVPNGPEHPSFSQFDVIEDYARNFMGDVEIVWGIKDPILGHGLKRIKNILPHAKVTEVDAGHFLQEECPKEIAEAIKRISL